MNPMFCETITLFNRCADINQITWQATVLDNCSYITKRSNITVGGAQFAVDCTIVRIPSASYHDRYRPPTNEPKQGYYSLSGDLRKRYFTLNAGDIVYRGETDFPLTEENRLTFLTENKGRVFTVKTAADNTFRRPLSKASHYKAVSE